MKIPPQAQRVFKGVIFDVYQWPQEMFDGSKQVFEAIKRPDCVQIIPVQGDSILIADEQQPSEKRILSLFGGRVDNDEGILEAAKREFLEETGMASDDWELFKSYDAGSKMEFSVHYFIARNVKKVAEPIIDPGERIIIKPCTFEQLVDLYLSGDVHGYELQREIMLMKLNPPKLEEFRRKLFPDKK